MLLLCLELDGTADEEEGAERWLLVVPSSDLKQVRRAAVRLAALAAGATLRASHASEYCMRVRK
eukprot:4506460-Prymnesium_polylepis.1